MNNLKSLLNKKKESSSEEAQAAAASQAGSTAGESLAGGHDGDSGATAARPSGIFGRKTAASHAPTAEAAASGSESTQASQDIPASTGQAPVKKAGLAGLKFATPAAIAGGSTGTGNRGSVLTTAVSDGLTDDLASLMATEDLGVEPKPDYHRFADHIDATAPTRELPADLEASQKQFVDLIDGVYTVLNEPDIAGSVIKNIMIELKSNPQYINKDPKKSLVAPDDVRTWIRVMRETMGLAKIVKQEVKTKRASGGKKSSRVDTDMLADLESLGLGIEL